MELTLTASTGTPIVVWRCNDTYCARCVGDTGEPEVCLAVDLFEVIAELAGLNLERDADAAEAVSLSEKAQQRLRELDADDPSDQRRRRSS